MALQAVIENAIEALQGEGIILISNALIQKPEENFRSYIEIEITDNGPGISDEIKKKIFEPFFTTKEEGTGMGLPLARKIMEDHDGQIEIQSQEGKYTRVRLLFPFREVSNG
jgi:signal transduction histidine kinase